MAVPSKPSLRSSLRRNHHRRPSTLHAVTDLREDRTGASNTAKTTSAAAAAAVAAAVAHRSRKRGRLDALFPDAATPPKKQKVTTEYPIRSRPVTAQEQLTTKADGVRTEAKRPADGTATKPPGKAALPRGGRVSKAAQPPPSGTIATSTRGSAATSRPSSTHDERNSVPAINGDATTPEHRPATDKRTLRSQDGGSRSRSELALYFPNYDELISNEPKETELLMAETRVFIAEDPPKSPKTAGKMLLLHSPARLPPTKTSPQKRKMSLSSALKPIIRPSDALNHYQTLDFANSLAVAARSTVDPLSPDVFATAHRRAERQEKQLRNIEKERAQHEKVQLERLYDGLRGPDWLRVMGISGVTESERRTWEGKRVFFVKEVGALLEKFRVWKEEEKRRKLEKEQAERNASEADESADEEGDEEEDEGEDEVDEEENEAEAEEAVDGESDGEASSSSPVDDVEIPDSDAASTSPPTSGPWPLRLNSPTGVDVDALAAQQLHTEALLSAKHPPNTEPWSQPSVSSSSSAASPAASGSTSAGRSRTTSGAASTSAGTAADSTGAPGPDPPLTSFFRKPHQRHSALATGRRSSHRVQMAYGEPIPEVTEGDFALPTALMTADARRASARSRRARKRT